MAPVLRPRPRPCTGHIRHRVEPQRDHPTTKSTTATASGRSSRISRWRRRRRHRNFNKSSSSPGSSVITPQPSDVLSGRGKGSYDWQGNVAYLQLLASFVPAYVATSSNKDKIHITQQIVSLIQKQGGRLLGFINNADKKNDNKKGRNTRKKNGGKLYVVSDEEARLRVSQALRRQRRLTHGPRVKTEIAGSIRRSSSSSSASFVQGLSSLTPTALEYENSWLPTSSVLVDHIQNGGDWNETMSRSFGFQVCSPIKDDDDDDSEQNSAQLQEEEEEEEEDTIAEVLMEGRLEIGEGLVVDDQEDDDFSV